MVSSSQILTLLREQQIPFEHVVHPAVFTVDDAAIYLSHLPGVGSKNLFLRDKSGERHFLVSVPDAKRVDLKELTPVLNCDRLSFASPERLKRLLGVDPGSVTLLGLVNDKEKEVETFIDQELWNLPLIHCHPLVNTETVLIAPRAMMTFFECIKHPVTIVKIPGV